MQKFKQFIVEQSGLNIRELKVGSFYEYENAPRKNGYIDLFNSRSGYSASSGYFNAILVKDVGLIPVLEVMEISEPSEEDNVYRVEVKIITHKPSEVFTTRAYGPSGGLRARNDNEIDLVDSDLVKRFKKIDMHDPRIMGYLF